MNVGICCYSTKYAALSGKNSLVGSESRYFRMEQHDYIMIAV